MPTVTLSDEFHSTMASEALRSMIEELTQEMAKLGSAASSHYARALCSMPNLRSLCLNRINLSDEFYSTMASEASRSKIEDITHMNPGLSSAAYYCPTVTLSDEFDITMASEALRYKIEELKHDTVKLGSAASSHYARGLCSMPNLRSLYLYNVKLSDEFYSTMASEASSSKIGQVTHDTAKLGSAASSHYARALCSMPNLRSLNLDCMKLSDEFYSTMASEASRSKIKRLQHWNTDMSSASLHMPYVTLSDEFHSTIAFEALRSKIEELEHETAKLGSAASSHFAKGLCSMPNLRSLNLNRVTLSDEFYLTMASEASRSKIKNLTHENADLGSVASSHYARGLCSMPNLRSLRLDSVKLSDEFYSTMASEASRSKIETLNHMTADLGSTASSHYARGLCFMPNLRSLNLFSVKLSDKFYSTMACEASQSKIEGLYHYNADLGFAASSHYARGLCLMPNLRSLKLADVKLNDKFYSSMASDASKSKIETLRHRDADLGSAASSHYARGLCSMPNLRSLELDCVKLSDEFYSTMASEASRSKIEELEHRTADLEPAASSHYARGLCFMPNLRSLNLFSVKLSDKFYSTMASEASRSKIEKLKHKTADLGSHASSHYARGLCSMPNLRSLGLNIVKLSDEFYSTMATEASRSKIEELSHKTADLGPAASSHYARGLCFMPNLRSLNLNHVKLSDEFYSTMATDALRSKIEKLKHHSADVGSAASSYYARGLCFMPNLRSLNLSSVRLSDEFFSTMATEAPKSKIEELTHDTAKLGSAASSHFARGLCSMPNLQSLYLDDVKLSDEFYSTISTEASRSKIEKLKHKTADLGPAASSHYAKGLCFMQNLRSLFLDDVKLSDEFYSTISTEASRSKIEKLKHKTADLGPAASSYYAKGLCSMQNLRSLNLDSSELSDEFYSTMATNASRSKIEDLTHLGSDLGSAASSHYARGLCFMPNLRSLELNSVKLSDEFYSTMGSESSKSKIQTLSMGHVSITPCRLQSILSLSRLQSLSLRDISRVDMDDREILTRQITSVDELSVDGEHVTSLWNLGLHTSCPRVKTLKLDWSRWEDVSSDIVTMACCPFHHLTHLHIQGNSFHLTSTTLNDHVSFCKGVETSCPRLTKLYISYIDLYTKAAEIIKLMKMHPHLTSIELNMCHTSADLDPLISEVNSEGKLTVTVKHGVCEDSTTVR
ncbi:uncharacterized protein LOC100889211 [Strongylocentrotus purpuratus]|uniref:Uncharacterized protein n=1 Tax=Strongylocentrotus purpuratus TaxID=7668 RepID=A0A7M7NVT5_STRPU|nr:uncharacterized protein LOC100889211 [Strongylocentrotus purpuratus]